MHSATIKLAKFDVSSYNNIISASVLRHSHVMSLENMVKYLKYPR